VSTKPLLTDIRIELKFIHFQREFDRACLSPPDWLTKLRRMRGSVIYDRGHRPCFRLPDGSFDDPDPSDLHSYHVVASQFGRPVGCARVTPLKGGRPCAIATAVGEETFDSVLSEIGTGHEQSCETSRWVVAPEYRNGLGFLIVAASAAVLRWTSRKIALVLAGTRQKQDRALIRAGARPIEGLTLFPSEIFDDELRLLYFHRDCLSKRVARHIDEMATAMKLDQMRSPARALAGSEQFTHEETWKEEAAH